MEVKNKPVDVLHVTGFDIYAVEDSSAHPSGGYIVYNCLKGMKYTSSLAVTIQKRIKDETSFYYPYGQHSPYSKAKTPREVAQGLPPHKILVVYGEELSPEQLRAIHLEHGSTIIMVLMTHDILAGGCSYPRTPNLKEGDIRNLSCDGYQKDCGNCPELPSHIRNPEDKTFDLLKRKKENFKNIPIIVAGVSSYSLSIAEKSSVFHDKRKVLLPILHDVPYSDTPKEELRSKFGIQSDKKIILWGTTQPENLRKGQALAEEIFNHLWSLMTKKEQKETILFCVGPIPKRALHKTQKFPVLYSGYLKSRAQMALAYKCSDVSLCTTVSDAGPMMITESLTNECPVVGFDRSVICDLVEDGVNGYIVKDLNTEEMAKKLLEVLRSSKLEDMRKMSRESALKYHDLASNKKKWENLISEVLENE